MEQSQVLLILVIVFTAFIIVGNIEGRRRVDAAVLRIKQAVEKNGGELLSVRKSFSTALLKGRSLGSVENFSLLVGVVSKVNPLTYLAARAAGRMDLVMLRGALRKPPQRNTALIRSRSHASQYAVRWGAVVGEINGFLVCGERPSPSLDKLVEELKNSGVQLVAVRSELPHVYAYIELRGDLIQATKAVKEAVEVLTA